MSFCTIKSGVSLIWLLTLVAVTILSSTDAVAQHPGPLGPCGDPTMESDMWAPVRGKVIKVIDGNTVIILRKDEKIIDGNRLVWIPTDQELLVHLVAVDTPDITRPFGVDARRLLERLVGGQEVEVWVSPSVWSPRRHPKQVTGVVYLATPKMEDANLAMIRSGIARHKESEPYAMSNYTECLYRLAEDEARAARRGLWQIRE